MCSESAGSPLSYLSVPRAGKAVEGGWGGGVVVVVGSCRTPNRLN